MKTHHSFRTAWTGTLLACLLATASWPCGGHAAVRIKPVGHWPPAMRGAGTPTSIVLQSNLAYVTTYGGLMILDVTDPTNCVFAGGLTTSTDFLDGAVAGGYAYLACYERGLWVVDVRDSSRPVRVGVFLTNSIAWGVAVSGSRAYVANYASGLHIVDITDPTHPVRLGGYDSDGNAYSGETRAVAVSGRYAYVADGSAGLQVLDVNDPANPVRVGRFATNATSVTVSGGFAYVVGAQVGGGGSLHVLNVINPANPVRVGGYYSGSPSRVAVAGNRAYLTDYYQGMLVLDVSNPANPSSLGCSTIGNGPVTAVGNYVYLGGGNPGVQVLEVSDPTNPVRVGGYASTASASKVRLAGNYAYVIGSYSGCFGLHVLDLSNPASPVRVSGVDLCAHGAFAVDDMAISGNFACIVVGQTWHIVDITNPANCVWLWAGAIQGTASWYSINDVAAADQRLYVLYNGNGSTGLQVVDVSNPTNAVALGNCTTDGSARDVEVAGTHAYVTAWDTGLEVIDVADPANPVSVGGCAVLGGGSCLAVSGNYVFVAAYWLGGMQIIDVSKPELCHPVGACYDWDAYTVAVSWPYAYVTEAWNSSFVENVFMIDVSDPANPLTVASCTAGTGAWSPARVSGNLVCLCDSDAVQVLETDLHPRLLVESLTRLRDGRCQFRVESAIDQVLEIQATTDWLGWSPVDVMTNSSGNGLFIDPIPGPDHRFYRARVLR